MEPLELLVDFHKTAERQGPGSPEATMRAIELAGLSGRGSLNIADIGCGTGASSLVLAQELGAQITALDLFQDFLDVLQDRAAKLGLADKTDTRACAMDALPFEEAEYDAVWSEGAVYIMGFEAGIRAWRRFLKPGGILAVSEITWLTQTRPAELQAHWEAEYPEIDTASAKMAILERNGYTPLGYFAEPEDCWMTHYYGPMEARFEAFLAKHGHSEAAEELVDGERREIALYRQYKNFYSYGFYIARRM